MHQDALLETQSESSVCRLFRPVNGKNDTKESKQEQASKTNWPGFAYFLAAYCIIRGLFDTSGRIIFSPL